jgi:hypothetical protein
MGPFRADGRGWRVFHACVRAWGSLPITSDKSDYTPLAERGFTHNAPLLETQVTAPSIPAPGSVLGSPPQAAGTNPGPIPVRLIWATVASWCPASTESGESVLKKFSLLRRLSLAWVGKAVASALERSFHDSHRTAVSPEIPPWPPCQGGLVSCLPAFQLLPNPPFLPASEPLFSPSCVLTPKSNSLAITV